MAKEFQKENFRKPIVKRNVPFSPPDMTEAEVREVSDTVLSGWITTGSRVKELERRIAHWIGVSGGTEEHRIPCCVCLNSATAAMEMVLNLLGVGPGDEVIVPAYTYTASASVIVHVGATIKMVDIQKDNFEMDYDKLADAITERTKVITPVDLAGVVCDYDRIFEIVESKRAIFKPTNEIQKKIGRVVVAADCAHAFGSERHGKMAGAIADFSSYSFHAVKNFTTGEGGAIVWSLPFGNEMVGVSRAEWTMNGYEGIPVVKGECWNDYLYRMVQLFSLHGQNKDALAKTKLGAWEYDIIGTWYKCNMTDIMAAIGLVQFKRYPEMLAKRRRFIERYNEGFKDLNVAPLKHYGPNWAGSGHLYIVRLLGKTREETNRVIQQMAERGITCNVHYKPLPMMTAYKKLGFDIKNYPNAFHFFENEITLPLNTCMNEEDLEYVIENFVDIVSNM
ncbi:DegT/DnrJ/EryC1/StrS family aminotransferase [Bacteroides pyogenes]|uniref:DegT/DnrJ/EryC1/StrS family aminotransferase n=1 Tax=Bacteroides pyogenes TaxID=310300 RepID=UPI001F390B8E|nr:DegT/DnrJ/EryC1/StrS family aminotransferase [Bacteroides pyogenes]